MFVHMFSTRLFISDILQPNIVKLHAYIDDMSVSALSKLSIRSRSLQILNCPFADFVLEYAPHGSLDELIAMHGPFRMWSADCVEC